MNALQETYGPMEFQNSYEHLCNIKQTGTVHDYRQKFAKRASCVHNWPEHCLLSMFLSGLKEEWKVDVRIQKPRSVCKAMSLALKFEGKADPKHNREPNFISTCKPDNPATWAARDPPFT